MGVGDYIHSKEAGQPRAPADLPPSQRQLRAEQAKVEVPSKYFNEPNMNGRTVPRVFQASPVPSDRSRALPENILPPSNGGPRDVFDTDVEAMDDSTVAGTSAFGFDDGQSQAPSTINAADENTSPRPSYLPRPTRRSYRSSFYGGLGDKAMKKAGFDTSDDGEDTASQLTSSLGGDDEMTEEPQQVSEPPAPEEPTVSKERRESSSWHLPHKHRAVEEPLSKRLENFWSASKRASRSIDHAQADPRSSAPIDIVSDAHPRKLGHMLPPPGARKITLPHSTSGTPRTRFSPPKPSLLDQLEISPTRHGSEPPPQAGRMLSMADLRPAEQSDEESEHEHGIDETIRVSSRRHSGHSAHAFDITNMSDLDRDDDELMQDPFLSQPASARRGRRNTVINTKKRQLEADYPPQLLYQKSFTDLQAEPFDKAPTPTPSPPVKSPSLLPNPPLRSNSQSPNDTVSQLLKLADEDRAIYLSRMSVDDWEDCGDQLIDRFSHLLTEMKKLRRARRRTAAVFEAEVKRRHEVVEAQNSELSTKLNEMRTGGAEVLRGRNA
ncbi:uncharacterized protein N7482_001905 [Penicillium canariense]|uniref:Extracellular mutant protein 11 C-terminal domain-containing protein n=1 Tax=Penicillium canariense TaxID=189055 RepID=A0A9W9LTE2_9EURO|nr:uncharacterized protein N7482_001905 [Penicillium canariense]KAJ5176028.1 hypothetical protein N7482_001905 [Penicillium canariense]